MVHIDVIRIRSIFDRKSDNGHDVAQLSRRAIIYRHACLVPIRARATSFIHGDDLPQSSRHLEGFFYTVTCLCRYFGSSPTNVSTIGENRSEIALATTEMSEPWTCKKGIFAACGWPLNDGRGDMVDFIHALNSKTLLFYLMVTNAIRSKRPWWNQYLIFVLVLCYWWLNQRCGVGEIRTTTNFDFAVKSNLLFYSTAQG